MRLAVLSNVTVDVLAAMMRGRHEVWTAPGFGAWMETALDPPRSLLSFAPEAFIILLDKSHASFDAADFDSAALSLKGRFPSVPVIVPDLEDLAEETENFYDGRMWTLASMPWSLDGLKAVLAETERLLALVRGGARKVLALDLDGVLWDGTIGEDGADGIVPRTEFQRGVKALKEEGVLLVALSKNNPEDVKSVWSRPGMVLDESDFASSRVNWNPKAAGLIECAEELNLATDAFVFVDDNPGERAEMAARIPDVAVADFPVTARRLRRMWFTDFSATDEDRARTEHFRAESHRRSFSEGLSIDDYLKGLSIRTDIHEMRGDEVSRVAQLSRKTNQFNVTTNRYTESEVRAFASDPSRLVMTMRVSDRFGDLGLVAFVHVAEGEIADWVMSCRAMNRRVEFELERAVEECLAARGITTLRAAWLRTAKNEPVRELFDRFGFRLVSADSSSRRYEKSLSNS